MTWQETTQRLNEVSFPQNWMSCRDQPSIFVTFFDVEANIDRREVQDASTDALRQMIRDRAHEHLDRLLDEAGINEVA